MRQESITSGRAVSRLINLARFSCPTRHFLTLIIQCTAAGAVVGAHRSSKRGGLLSALHFTTILATGLVMRSAMDVAVGRNPVASSEQLPSTGQRKAAVPARRTRM